MSAALISIPVPNVSAWCDVVTEGRAVKVWIDGTLHLFQRSLDDVTGERYASHIGSMSKDYPQDIANAVERCNEGMKIVQADAEALQRDRDHCKSLLLQAKAHLRYLTQQASMFGMKQNNAYQQAVNFLDA